MTVPSKKIAGVIVIIFGSFLLIDQLNLIRSYWGSISGSPEYGMIITFSYLLILGAHSMIMAGGIVLCNDSGWGANLALIGGIVLASWNLIPVIGLTGSFISGGGWTPIELFTALISIVVGYTLLPILVVVGATIAKRVD